MLEENQTVNPIPSDDANQGQSSSAALKVTNARDGAIVYAGFGIRTWPANYVRTDGKCSCNLTSCTTIGKHPKRPPNAPSKEACIDAKEKYLSWLDYALQAPPKSPEEAAAMFTEEYWQRADGRATTFAPEYINACVVPDDGIVIVEFDSKGGKDGFLTALDRRVDVHAEKFKTLSQQSPGGSVHLVYKRKTAVVQKSIPGLLGRTSGIDLPPQIIAAGSLVLKGQYQFINVQEPAPEPEWLSMWIREYQANHAKATKSKAKAERDATRASEEEIKPDEEASVEAFQAWLNGRDFPTEGTRNAWMYTAACFGHDFGVSEAVAYNMLCAKAEADGAGGIERDWRATVASAYTGAKNEFGCRSPLRQSDGRPVVYLTASRATAYGTLTDKCGEIDRHLAAVENLNLYRNEEGELVAVVHMDRDETADGIEWKRGVPKIIRLDSSQVKAVIERNILLRRFDKTSGEFLFTNCNDELATRYGAYLDWGLPLLRGISGCPFPRPDGSLATANGYDPATGVYLHFDGVLPEIPERPYYDDAADSYLRLSYLVDGFHFADAPSQAVALCSLMQAVTRKSYAYAPQVCVDGGDTGIGKSFLTEVDAALSTGREVINVALGPNEDENEKRLSAALRSGIPMFNIDNVRGMCDGELWLSMLTGRASIRPFGRNDKLVEVDSRVNVSVTGIGLTFSDEMVRRSMMCRLLRPSKSYSHNPVAEILANRGRYVADVLTLVRFYHLEGCPPVAGARPVTHLAPWDRMVRLPLMFMGAADPLATQEAIRATDPERAKVEGFALRLALARGTGFEGRSKLTRLLPSSLSASPTKLVLAELYEWLKEHATPRQGDKPDVHALGNLLRDWTGRPLTNGLTIRCKKDASHGSSWYADVTDAKSWLESQLSELSD